MVYLSKDKMEFNETCRYFGKVDVVGNCLCDIQEN